MRRKTLVPLAAAAAGIALLIAFSRSGPDGFEPPDAGPDAPAEEPEDLVPPPLVEAPEAPADETEEYAGETGDLTVLVLDHAGAALPGATVTTAVDKMPAARRKATTDAGGRAVFKGLPAGKKISVQATAGLTAIPATKIAQVETAKPGEVTLTLEEGGAITGSVFGEGGAPIGGAFTISVRQVDAPGQGMAHGLRPRIRWRKGGRAPRSRQFPAATDVFQLGGLLPGHYVVTATAEGYQAGESEPVEVVEVVRGGITEGVAVSLERGGRITGVVVRRTTGRPVKDAQVWIRKADDEVATIWGTRGGSHGASAKTETDEEGRFVLDAVEPGKYRVSATAKNLCEGHADDVVVEKDRDSAGVMLSLGEGGAITGTVHGPDGKPLPEATVLVSREQSGIQVMGDFGTRVKAGKDGVYHIEHLEPGKYRVRRPKRSNSIAVVRLRVNLGGDEGEEKAEDDADTVRVREGEVTRFDLFSERMATITGRVTDDAGKPVKGRMVRLLDDEPGEPAGRGMVLEVPRFARSDENGEFRFDGLEPGAYTVLVTGERERVRLDTGAKKRVELRIAPARVEGRVIDGSGNPVKGVRVKAESAGRGTAIDLFRLGTAIAVTDAEGRFRIGDLEAGTFRLRARSSSGDGVAEEFALRRGEARTGIVIRLVSRVEVRVEVLDAAGDPVKGAIVRARGDARVEPRASTDARGRATLRLLPGTWTISADSPFGTAEPKNASREFVAGSGGPQTITLRLE